MRKLSLLVGLTLALLLAVLLAGSWFYWRAVLRQQVDAHLSAVAASRRDMVQAQVTLLLQRVELNTDRGEMRGLLYARENGQTPTEENKSGSQTSLERIADGDPITVAALSDTAGNVLLSTKRAAVGRNIGAEVGFTESLTNPHMTLPRWVNGRFESVLAAPIRTRSDPKRAYGVLLATADVSQLAAVLRDVTGLGETGEALLAVREGDQFRFLFPPRNSPQTTVAPLNTSPALTAAFAGSELFAKYSDYRGVRVLAAGRPVDYGGWGLVVKMDEREAYAPISRALRLGVLFGLLVAALGLAAAYVLARSFTSPLRQLARAAARVASGNDSGPVPVTSADEFGALSESFNEMTAAIRARRVERDEADRALRESEERSRQITESLPQLVWTCDAKGACDYLSPQWVEYTGIPTAPQLGAGWLEQIHPDDRGQLAEQWMSATSSGDTFDVQFRIRRSDGVYRWFRTRAVPLRNASGHVVKWFGTNTDIDDIKHAEETLRETDRRKDEFLAMLGHELRNPLSAIANAVRLWKDAPNETDNAELAQKVIERQTVNLSRHVDDLLDVVRISAGKIELRKQPIDLGEAIGRAVETAQRLINEKHQKLEVTLSEGGPLRVDADATRIEQIMTNLLINASKYTPEGGRIRVAERGTGGEAIITVSDNGMGISPDVLPVIFDLFRQGDRSLHRTAGGLGIGLSLCRQLVELHGGSISARSNGPGCGAEFTVRLPVTRKPAPAPSSPTPIASDGRRRRVLLVDDNEDATRLFSRLLTRWGHEVLAVGDGIAALDAAQKFQPDVLLLDIGLPGLDGYTLARQLRAKGFAKTPMIALSGYAQESDRQLGREAGFDHHFSKPVDFDALAALLAAPPTPARD